MQEHARAAVVAAHSAAAQAGADILKHGGSAVDAAIATAFALAVVDPQNCGIGGHGGAMLVQSASGMPVTLIDFNTAVPEGFDPRLFARAPRCGTFVVSGVAVSVPAVVTGLEYAHGQFGKLSFADLVQPAIVLARGGYPLGIDLARSLAWAKEHHPALSAEFKAVFFAGDRPLTEGAALKQPALARTLQLIASSGAAALHHGPLAESICDCVTRNGGKLSVRDLRRRHAEVRAAESVAFAGATVHGPRRETTGYGILCDALGALDVSVLGANRSAQYVQACASALRAGWAKRLETVSALVAGHTTHLCACDNSGMLVSMTFTHGPTWFGSGLVAPDTGIVLNSGSNLFVRPKRGGAAYPVHNMCPVIVECAGGARHAIGSPGGSKIPANVMQLIVDAVYYRVPLGEAIGLPRVSVAPGGGLEAEPDLLPLIPASMQPRAIERDEYYGPAGALSLDSNGCARAAPDRRFSPGVATA